MLNRFVALDLETTGVDPSNDEIIEIGMARIVEGKVVATFNQLVNPDTELSQRIIDITSITPLDLIGKPSIEEIIGDAVEFIGDDVILGHNVAFDYSFLKVAAKANNKNIPNKVIDTLKIARKLLPELPSRKLVDLCAYFNIDPGHSHRAYDDAISAFRLYEKLAALTSDEELINGAEEVFYSIKKTSPITAAQIRFLSSLCAQHNLTLEKSIEEFTKSEASKAIDGILSNYGR
ncbi:3'-5' exonuclease [Lachnospira pectinoschiza]|uniref:DNA polymerase-3 subunit alpha n=1 Tax=Lachnospira pectinoschiza TaxID=28052 RepID=A0A1G9XS61_9FIRM|nr:3'-5' exonuclease [Lachnospira pectinoschiza]SDM99005.1 DNA polymerase-3 subunit alpha [Lachnospira pectinoschiza]